jgi:hypothetical protein
MLPYIKIRLVPGFQIAAGARKKTDSRLLTGSETVHFKIFNFPIGILSQLDDDDMTDDH